MPPPAICLFWAIVVVIVTGLGLFIWSVARAMAHKDKILLANAAENARLQEERDAAEQQLISMAEKYKDPEETAPHRPTLAQRKKRGK